MLATSDNTTKKVYIKILRASFVNGMLSYLSTRNRQHLISPVPDSL
jgi:hypothetical protein